MKVSTEPLTLRTFQREDQETLRAMFSCFFQSPALVHPIESSVLDRLLEDCLDGTLGIQGYALYLARELVGFGLVTHYYASEVAGQTLQFEDLYIRPEYRGRGLAKQYFRYFFDHFPGIYRFRLEVAPDNEKAIALYKKLGFKFLSYKQMVREGAGEK